MKRFKLAAYALFILLGAIPGIYGARKVKVQSLEPLSGRQRPTAIPLPDTLNENAENQVRSPPNPVVGYNYITIWIASSPSSAQSNAPSIRMNFGWDYQLNLLGYPPNIVTPHFPKGQQMTWNMNKVENFLRWIDADAWDDIALRNYYGDGMKIARVKIVHSSVTILDWNANEWLDGSKMEPHFHLGLTAKILEHKLDAIDNSFITQLHYAARELGKTDGEKYDTPGFWCSEFASWALRKALWDTPENSIGSQQMESFFSSRGRLITRAQLLSGVKLHPGDYLRLKHPGTHSGLFVKYIDNPARPSNSTRIRTIEGNTGARVALGTWKYEQIVSAGNTR